MTASANWKPTWEKGTPGQSPRAKLTPVSPMKRSGEDINLNLKTVLGTTTRSANAFDADPEGNTFVCCAGPAVVLYQVDEDFNISQRCYRARPNVPPINATQSFYHPSTPPNTPMKSRHGSPLKNMGVPMASTILSEQFLEASSHDGSNNRNREVTSVSMSHEGSLLAVGETGYNPRVLLFSTKTHAPTNIPLSILTDHSFGVCSVAFSEDARWLCTLGNGYDGFILIYSINATTGSARLQFSNKISNASHVFWMGSSVVSVGIRHVKVWRVDHPTSTSPSKKRPDLNTKSNNAPGSPIPKRFLGRNSLLGPLIDSTFVHGIAVSYSRAILCTIQGDICVLDDTQQSQDVKVATRVGFTVLCSTFDRQHQLVSFAGEGGIVQSIALGGLVKCAAPSDSYASSSPTERFPISDLERRPDILAIGVARDRLVTVSSDEIALLTVKESGRTSASPNCARRLPAHGDAVLGICSLLPKASLDSVDFLSYSKNGRVSFWKLDGSCTNSIEVALDQRNAQISDNNELKTLTVPPSHDYLLTGDKYGILRLTECSGRAITAIQAHASEVNGVAIGEQESSTLIASCGRDRTVQVFQKTDQILDLRQTLDDHTSSVTNLMLTNRASTLISISSDRTISIRTWVSAAPGSQAFVSTRLITLKASPVSFAGVPNDPDQIVLSTMDRQIQKYDISSGRLLHSFKISDPYANEAILLNCLNVCDFGETDNKTRVLIGASSTDKTIRVHDYESGSLLAKEHGQIAVSNIRHIEETESKTSTQHYVVTAGFDGTVVIWDLAFPCHSSHSSSASSNSNESPLAQAPMIAQPERRILSRAEISNLQRNLEGAGVTPVRKPSPTSTRRKTSKFSLAAASKFPTPLQPDNTDASPFDTGNHDSRFSPIRTSRTSKQANMPTLNRRKSKSAANLNDINDAAKDIVGSLQVFRNRITSAAIDKLDKTTAQELESELETTCHALRERLSKAQIGSQTTAGDSLDSYIAKMIDERLALRARSDNDRNDITAIREIDETNQAGATVGARDISSNSDC